MLRLKVVSLFTPRKLLHPSSALLLLKGVLHGPCITKAYPLIVIEVRSKYEYVEKDPKCSHAKAHTADPARKGKKVWCL